ncbi:MAG: dihydropteroate synthase [Holosporaceae bacterium]|jgi:2-amino-4-hydroxy-6-hydroxymethyldihydropteridine diphosphokinase/dihydropteroate synthase|nr:dihydropteroate synthase [Holosporaceae bacterium]
MIYLSIGSNLGNRFKNLRVAVSKLSDFFSLKKSSIVIETAAILPPAATCDWDLPYLNMIVAGKSTLDPFTFLNRIKNIEKEMGRDLSAPKWSPRIIDIDIIQYDNEKIDNEHLTIPHKEVKNRDFLQYLLKSVGCEFSENFCFDDYRAINYFVLDPKLVGIVNITPDSFSDGGKYFDHSAAINHINQLYCNGTCVIELGAQSTRPNYVEISASEEISRIDKILEQTKYMDCIGIDTYFDDVVKYVIKKYDLKWINDIKSQLDVSTIKMIADSGAKLVVMLYGTDITWFRSRADYLQNLGIKKENIVLDPGVGFAKNKYENIEIIRNISRIRDIGCEVMFAHSRKSFMSSFSNTVAADRDVETIAISDYAAAQKMDYLRVHNIQNHMRFFVARHFLESA